MLSPSLRILKGLICSLGWTHLGITFHIVEWSELANIFFFLIFFPLGMIRGITHEKSNCIVTDPLDEFLKLCLYIIVSEYLRLVFPLYFGLV